MHAIADTDTDTDVNHLYGKKKKPIKQNHIKEFGGRDASEASQGQTRDKLGNLGHLGLIYV